MVFDVRPSGPRRFPRQGNGTRFPPLTGFSTLFILLGFSVGACSGYRSLQNRTGELVASGDYVAAYDTLSAQPDAYGSLNRLIYHLDLGMIAHLMGDNARSIPQFELAKEIYAENYTISISKESATFLLNDNAAPYRGEDFEAVMVHLFQAVNYWRSSNLEGALVEIRQVDSLLSAINTQYGPGEKNTYTEDAFARLLSGILYEGTGTFHDLNEAHVSYRKAMEIYSTDYQNHYGVRPPGFLSQRLDKTGRVISTEHDSGDPSLSQEGCRGEIYFLHYLGRAPVKEEQMIIVPVPGGRPVPLAFPTYRRVPITTGPAVISARNTETGFVSEAQAELVEDISAVAIESLNNRKARTLTKLAVRAAIKYQMRRQAQQMAQEKYGSDTAVLVGILGDIVAIGTERADLRSWKTLPAQIHMTPLSLPPGEYDLRIRYGSSAMEEFLHDVVRCGERKIIVLSSP